jgi:hypothetical protein
MGSPLGQGVFFLRARDEHHMFQSYHGLKSAYDCPQERLLLSSVLVPARVESCDTRLIE